MTFQPPVYVSFTTIPSRLTRIVEKNLEHLLKQDYPNIQKFCICIPKVNRRGQLWTDNEKWPSIINNERIRVSRPLKDYGPIMKYIGSIEDLPPDAWVWICDDDQLYRTDLISRCVEELNKIPQDERERTVLAFRSRSMYLHSTVIGYCSAFLHISALKEIEREITDPQNTIPNCCFNIDDDLVSIILNQKKFKVQAIPARRSDLFESKNDLKETEDALSAMGTRATDQFRCYYALSTKAKIMIISLSVLSVCFVCVVLFLLVRSLKRFHQRKKMHRNGKKERSLPKK